MTTQFATTPCEYSLDEPLPPRRPTRARLQTYFLRELARTGSVSEAAACAGIAARTVRRWRAVNPIFARRYDAVLAERVELLEDRAMNRALGPDRRPVFHGGRQVAVVERHNDAMLMRVLARFDRLRERQEAEPEDLPLADLSQFSTAELVEIARLPVPPDTPPEKLKEAVYMLVLRELEKLTKESGFAGQRTAIDEGQKIPQDNKLPGSVGI